MKIEDAVAIADGYTVKAIAINSKAGNNPKDKEYFGQY